jgi:hypothetical protein
MLQRLQVQERQTLEAVAGVVTMQRQVLAVLVLSSSATQAHLLMRQA